jgi:FAD/FMN-containing dehydrogenase
MDSLDPRAQAAHEERVHTVAEAVRARPAGLKLTIAKAHPGHTPHDLAYKRGCHPVPVDGLNHILALDKESRTAVVEGQVTLRQLCREAFTVGLMPKVVPEFETFTVAGLVNGLGLETTSHRHGVFPASVRALEVVCGNGEVVEADRQHHGDLLAHIPGSYGTLGVVTRATVELEEAKPFVRSRYWRFASRRDYVRAFAAALDEHHFVEGFVLGEHDYVLVTGSYSERVGALDVFDAMTPGHLWYYQHAARMSRGNREDLVPSYEYMFRHQRSLLWVAGIVADLRVFSHTRVGRAYLDRAVEKQVASRGFKGNMPVELVERCIINQDMGMTLARLEEGIEYVQKNLKVAPLWNCAVGHAAGLPFATPRKLPRDTRYVVDIGIYGEPRVRNYRAFAAMRALQKFVDVPSLWGCCYLTAEELREAYDFASYEAVQQRYHAAEAFVPLESKIRFMRAGGDEGPIPLWRLVNLYYDIRAKLRAAA